jgi:small GTP-binding protein
MASPSSDFDDIYKIVILGDSQVGKTSFLSAFIPVPCTHKKLYNDFEAKTVALKGGKKVNTQVWDLSGEAEFHDIANLFYKDASGAFVLFDLTSSRSFTVAQSWVTELKAESPSLTVILIGNKRDVCEKHSHLRQVAEKTAASFARAEKIGYREICSRSEREVGEAFEDMLEKVDDGSGEMEKETQGWKMPAVIGLFIVLVLFLFNL